MTLITADELARSALLVTFGSLAGGAALAWPGSPLWLVPAALGVAGGACTVPEIRQELRATLPTLQTAHQRLAAVDLPLLRRRAAQPRLAAPVERDPLLTTLAEHAHRLIIGHTRGGKTTLMHELASTWARDGDHVLVCDPDAAPGQWPGCRVVGGGDNFEAISHGLALTQAELSKRRQQRADGRRQFPPLHLVIDESQDVLAEVEEALPLIEALARRGAKLNMRLTLGVQDKQVKTLGLEGKGDLLRNFVTADVYRDRDGRRVAQLRDSVSGGKITYPIPQLPDPESFIIAPQLATPAPTPAPRPSSPPAPALAPKPAPAEPLAPATSTTRLLDRDAALLASLLAESVSMDTGAYPVSTAAGRDRHTPGVSVSVSNSMDTDTGHTPVSIHVTATAAAGHTPVRRRRPAGRGLDMRRRRQRTQELEQLQKRNDLAAAYAKRRAAGWSYRQAYAELGGNSAAARAAWQSAGERGRQ